MSIDTLTAAEVTGNGTSTTGRMRRRWLTWRGWVLITVIVVVIAVISFLVHGAATQSGRLDAENPKANGMRALTHTLADHGVTVHTVDTVAKAVDQTSDDTTLVVFDRNDLLTSKALDRLSTAATGADVVLIAPSRTLTRALAPRLVPDGNTAVSDPAKPQSLTQTPPGTIQAGCNAQIADDAETITAGGRRYRAAATATGVAVCFAPQSHPDSGTVATYTDGGRRTVIGNWSVLANGRISDHGNAALALGALGGNDDVVYYQPSASDPALQSAAKKSVIDVLPPWALPAAGWLVLVAIVTIIWRGRRLGPLVTEPLPVVVRAAETLEGRARLYRRSHSIDRAALTLRAGTMSRIAGRLKLPVSAGAEQVCRETAAATGRGSDEITDLLVRFRPGTERELAGLAGDLLKLEREVRSQ